MPLDLFLFTVDPARARAVVRAGGAGVVVDWERRGKHRRQDGEGTEVNAHTADDLARMRLAVPWTTGRVLCRIDAVGPHTAAQVDRAVRLGADEVVVPMVRTPEELDRALDTVAGRCGVALMVETQDAVERIDELARRPLTRVYVGLNDLRIDRRATSLFEPLVDGTVEQVRRAVTVPFGVAGLTRVGSGAPVPTRLIAGELARLDAAFTFLRRSFLADVPLRDTAPAVARMLAAFEDVRRRTDAQVVADAAELLAAVAQPARQPA